jgi:hypothetical protein
MKERTMFGRTKHSQVSFCERCGEVCDASCRAESLRRLERERLQLFAYGWRSV